MELTLFFLRHGPALSLGLVGLGAALAAWTHGALSVRVARRRLRAWRHALGAPTDDLDALPAGTPAVVAGVWLPSGERGVHGIVRTPRGDVRVLAEPRVMAGHLTAQLGLRPRFVDPQLVAGRRVALAGAVRRRADEADGYRASAARSDLAALADGSLIAVADEVVAVPRAPKALGRAALIGCFAAVAALKLGGAAGWAAVAHGDARSPQGVAHALAALGGDHLEAARQSYRRRLDAPTPASRALVEARAEAADVARGPYGGDALAVETLLAHGQFRRAAWRARRAHLPLAEARAWYAMGDFRRASDALALHGGPAGAAWETATHVLARRWDRALAGYRRPRVLPSWTGDDVAATCVPLLLRARMEPQPALAAARLVMAQRDALNRGREPVDGRFDPAWWSCPRVVLDTVWRAGGSARELEVALSAGREESIEAVARALPVHPADAFVGRALAVDLDAPVSPARAASVAAVRARLDAFDLPAPEGDTAGAGETPWLLGALRRGVASDEEDPMVPLPGLRAELRWGRQPRRIEDLPSRRLGALHHRRAAALLAGDAGLAREVDGILHRYVSALSDRDVAVVIWFLENR